MHKKSNKFDIIAKVLSYILNYKAHIAKSIDISVYFSVNPKAKK